MIIFELKLYYYCSLAMSFHQIIGTSYTCYCQSLATPKKYLSLIRNTEISTNNCQLYLVSSYNITQEVSIDEIIV